MSMFDSLGKSTTTNEVPSGVALAKVDRVTFNDERGVVGVKYYFHAYRTSEWSNHFIFKKDGSENKMETDRLFKMFNTIGIPIDGKAQMKEAFEALVNQWWMVEKSVNDRGFKNFVITGPGLEPARGEHQAAPTQEVEEDEELPF